MMEDPELFTLPCRLGDSKPFDTLADLRSCVNIISLCLFKKLNIRLLEEIGHIFGKAKIVVGEGITRSVFGVKGVDLGKEEEPYWTTLGKSESYKPRPSSDGIGAQTPYYARKDFLDCHLPKEWEIARDAEINPFKDILVFRRMVEFLGAHFKKSSFAKPCDVNAPGPSRKSPKHVSFQSPREFVGSNDMVHNYYLVEAKKTAQLQKDKALNTKPSVQQSARLPNTANGNKPKPRN
nr:hypothetical protein [Tanacetum cinerariifolium]